MAPITMVTGVTTKSTAMEFTNGQTVASMRVNGARINYTTEAFIHGQMVAGTMDNIWTTRSTAGVSTYGPTAKSTKDTGIMGSSMARVGLQTLLAKTELVYGSMAKE